MEYYKRLSQIRDTYPGEPDTVYDSYTSVDGKSRITGIYPQNFIVFDTVDISELILPNVQTTGVISFNFIVRFRNGDVFEDWTSPQFLSKLQSAKNENNPYFTYDVNRDRWPQNKVTIAEVNFENLSRYYDNYEFRYPQLYANVRITDTITTKEDMLIHINWMVSGQEDLRPVRSFGSWVVELTDSLGFEYADAIKSIENGEPVVIPNESGTRGNSNQNILLVEPRGDYSTSTVIQPTTDGTLSNTTTTGTRGVTNATIVPTDTIVPIQTRSSTVNTNYTPFNSAGRYIGEIRASNGVIYIWSDNKWNIIDN